VEYKYTFRNDFKIKENYDLKEKIKYYQNVESLIQNSCVFIIILFQVQHLGVE
jgi:hypothetical protein